MLIKDKVKNKDKFTLTENQISEYILENAREVVDMPLEDLAAKLYVSKSTIIRFCKKLGFRGHKELCVQLAKEINTFLLDDKTMTGSAPFGRDDTFVSIAHKILALEYQALTDTYNGLEISQVEEASELLTTHKKIRVYGNAQDFPIVEDFSMKLQRLGKDVRWSNVPGIMIEETALQDADSCAVIFSYEAKNDIVVNAAEMLHRRMIPIILITGPFKGNLQKSASIVLRSSFTEERPKIGAMGSRTGMFLIADILYSMIFLREYDKNVQQITEVEDLLKEAERKQ